VQRDIKVGSFFAGVGGVCLGFKNAGASLVFANEFNSYACSVYNHNFDHNMIEGDIEKVLNPAVVLIDNGFKEQDITTGSVTTSVLEDYLSFVEKRKALFSENIDILTAGFPCQPFSQAGNQLGFEDRRGNLFYSVIDYINKCRKKPSVLFLENVKGLKTHDNGRTYEVIKELIELEGYIVKEKVFNTHEYSNLPQNRERLFIVCFLNKDQADEFTYFDEDEGKFDSKTKADLKVEIDSVLETNVSDLRYLYTKEKYPHLFLTEDEYFFIQEDKRKAKRLNLDESIVEEYEFYQLRRNAYIRKNMKGICPTLTANMGTGGHNVPLVKQGNIIRKITEKESFALQGFPVFSGEYSFPKTFKSRSYPKTQLYKQAGNSVSVPVVESIARKILDTF